MYYYLFWEYNRIVYTDHLIVNSTLNNEDIKLIVIFIITVCVSYSLHINYAGSFSNTFTRCIQSSLSCSMYQDKIYLRFILSFFTIKSVTLNIQYLFVSLLIIKGYLLTNMICTMAIFSNYGSGVRFRRNVKKLFIL